VKLRIQLHPLAKNDWVRWCRGFVAGGELNSAMAQIIWHSNLQTIRASGGFPAGSIPLPWRDAQWRVWNVHPSLWLIFRVADRHTGLFGRLLGRSVRIITLVRFLNHPPELHDVPLD